MGAFVLAFAARSGTFAWAGFGVAAGGAFLAVGLTSAADRGRAPTCRAVTYQAQANRDQHPADALPWVLRLAARAGAGAACHRCRPVVGERL
ncbi:MAG TPA: hypothetical protein VIJ96_06495 [Acidothermaceae bacterium]